jgi:TP901 family phage tail tape measure protein
MADGRIIIDTKIDNKGAESGLESLSSITKAGLKGTVVALGAAATTVGGLSMASIKVGSNFESSMSQVAATMGMTSEEINNGSETFERLRQAAKDAGAKTKFSATQAGEALNYLALAGYDADKSIAALPVVLDLAAAGGLGLGYASDMVTDSMSALGIKTSELSGFVDKLAKTSQKSNTNIGQLGEAILTVGGTAKVLAGGTTELNAVLGILADNGVKGAEGGTALRNMILSLSAPTDTARESIEKLGLKVFVRPLNDTFNDLNGILSTMTQGEQTQVLNQIFNKTDLKSVNALLANSGERFDELSGYINDCDGAAANMAKAMDDNLKGRLTILGSSLEGLGIQVYEKLETPLKTATETAIASLDILSQNLTSGELSGSIDRIAEGFGNLISVLAELFANVLPKLIEGFAWLLDNGAGIATIIGTITGAIFAFKAGAVITSVVQSWQKAKVSLALYKMTADVATISQGVMNGVFTVWETVIALITGKTTLAAVATGLWTKAQTALNVAMSANHIGIILVAIVAVIGAIIYLWNTNEGFRNFVIGSWNAILDAGKAVWGWLVKFFTEDIPKAWGSMISWFGSTGDWFVELWGKIKQGLVDGWNSIVSFFTESIPAWWESVKQSFVTGWQAIGNFFTETIPALIEAIFNWFNELPYKIGYALLFTLTVIKNWTVDAIETFIQCCENIIYNVTEWFMKLPGVIWEWLLNTIAKVIEFKNDLGNKASEAGSNMVEKIIDAVKDLPSKFLDIGVNIVKGIWNGITSMDTCLNNKVSGFFQGMLDGAKDANEIKSPSKLYRDQVGKYMAQGVGVGFEDEADNVPKTMEKDFKRMAGKMQLAVDYNMVSTTAGIVARNNQDTRTNTDTTTSTTTENKVIIEVPLILEGREAARAIAPYQNIFEDYSKGR